MPLDITELLIALFTLVVAPLTATVTWKFSKRKNKAEADSVIVSGANQAVDTMIVVLSELREQVALLQEETEILRAENRMLHKQVRELKNEVTTLRSER